MTLIEVPPLPRRLYNGAMEPDTRPAIILQHIHSGFSLAAELSFQGLATYSRLDFKHKGIGSKEVSDDDEVLLSPEEALQACRNLQKSLENAFISLLRVLTCPPKVYKPKLLDSKVRPNDTVEFEFAIVKESVDNYSDPDKADVSTVVKIKFESSAVVKSSTNIIDIDSEAEDDEEDLLLNKKKLSLGPTKVLKPKLSQIAPAYNTSFGSVGDMRKSTIQVKKPKLTKVALTTSSIGLPEEMKVKDCNLSMATVTETMPGELLGGGKKREQKMSLSSDEEALASISSDSGVCACVDKAGPNTRGGGGPETTVAVVATKQRCVTRKSSVCNFKKIGKCVP